MDEQDPGAGLDDAVPGESYQPGHALAGVYRIQNQCLQARGHGHGGHGGVVHLSVTGCQHGVGHHHIAFRHTAIFSDQRCDLAAAFQDPRVLLSRAPPHANPGHRHIVAQRPQSHQQAAVGQGAAGCHHHVVERQIPFRHLLRQLPSRNHITESAKRRVVGPQVDDERVFSGSREMLGKLLHGSIGRRLVLPHRERRQARTQQLIQQHIAGMPVALVHVRHAIFQLDVDIQSLGAGGGRGGAHKVRLHGAGDQQRVRILRDRGTQVELQLAHFVAAGGEPGAVVALYVEIDAQRFTQGRSMIQRRRDMPELYPGKRVKGIERRVVDQSWIDTVYLTTSTEQVAWRTTRAAFGPRRYWARSGFPAAMTMASQPISSAIRRICS